VAACGGEATNQAAPQNPAEPPPPESGGAEVTGGPAGPAAAPPDGGHYQFESCVKECVRRKQAQAIPIEQIEMSCQGECTEDKE
jgi:hypothetical protein